jgi:two-component system phosphate regulon sensor histidine kinase PhoR
MLNHKNLKYYIALMGFALVGLIALQFSWLNMAYQTNQEKFKYNIKSALHNVANSLPFAEANYYVDLAKKDSIEKPNDLVVKLDKIETQNNIQTTSNNSNYIPKKEITKPEQITIDINHNNYQPKNAQIIDKNDIYEDFLMDKNENLAPFNKEATHQQDFLTQFIQNENKWNQEIIQMLNKDFENFDKLFQENLKMLYQKSSNYNFIFKVDSFLVFSENFEPKTTIQIQKNPSFNPIILEKLKTLTKKEKKITYIDNKKPKTIIINTTPKENFVAEKDASARPIDYTINKTEALKNPPLTPASKPKIEVNDKKDLLKLALKLNEITTQKIDIKTRLKNVCLEERINKELKQRGIDLKYEFTVGSQSKNLNENIAQKGMSYLYQANEKAKKIAEKGFFVELFPHEQGSTQQHFLFINFPNQNQYLWQNMWGSLLTSLLFVSLVIFCFAKAISTILKQKKISEITNDFINNMTHELKTPISTVALACEALQDKDIQQMPKQQNRYLAIIQEENKRLGLQVERVLQMARLDKGDVQMRIEEVDAHQIIENAVSKIALQIENRGGKIETQLNATQAHIKADECHFTNIILNLLDNANKYSPNPPDILIKTENTKNSISITISDKGQGMSKEQQSKVFDKFYRVPTGNVHNVKGFGLGLSYVKTMTIAQNGNVSLKSELGKGSSFILEFPKI